LRTKVVICTNQNGDQIIISPRSFYKLQEDIDTTAIKASVTYANNFQTQGETPVSTRLEKRNLSLLFYIDVEDRSEEWIQERRDELFRVFNPLFNPIRIEISTELRNVFIDAHVELSPSISPTDETVNEYWHDVLVQFTAGNPYFQDINQQKVEIAVWEPMLEFELEVTDANKIEAGRRTSSLIVNVLNNGQVPTGMLIKFKAIGTAANPSLFNVNTREQFKVNKVLTAGEVIIINTNQGKKRVESKLNGITTNIFNQIDYQSKFMQLAPGDNLFRYNADSNVENIEVSIYFTPQYLGV